MHGKRNLIAGFWGIGLFMIFGFVLIYLRDFAPDAQEWAANYASGKHFETRLAHVHGALFTFLNIVFGYLLLKLDLSERHKALISWSALVGLLMPVGILAEVLFGAPPLLVLVGALSITFSAFMFGYAVLKS